MGNMFKEKALKCPHQKNDDKFNMRVRRLVCDRAFGTEGNNRNNYFHTAAKLLTYA